MNQQIYERLLSVARDRNRGYTTYSEISPLAGLDMENPADRDKMSRLLEEIAKHEQDAARPMLTAVVIHQADNIPGEGFFKMASEFGRFNGREKLRFWINALNEVHEYWRGK
jgi:hypothetical protein